MRIRRREKGSVIAFSAVLALALVILGVAFVFLMMYMGGQQETKNAIDAGALNVGKQALDDVKVKIGVSDIDSPFFDCTSDTDDGSEAYDGYINLRRINRVWAKALLIGINAQAQGAGQSSAQSALSQAQSISDQLNQKLNDPSNLYDYFTDYSKANSVRMIGTSVQTDKLAGPNWQTSLVDRTPVTPTPRESNIVVSNSANPLPPGFTGLSGMTTKTTRNQSVGGNFTFLKGYSPLSAGGSTFWQVPFQYDEKPRLISRSIFESSMPKASPIEWSNPVPNAFSVEGQAIRANAASEKGRSWVLTNPHMTYQMSMPHSYMLIHLNQMVTKWYFFTDGVWPLPGLQPDQNYGYDLESQSSLPELAGGLCLASVNSGDVDMIGSDVFGLSLDGVIFNTPSSTSTATLEADMTARFNEMVSKSGNKYEVADMHAVLDDFKTRGLLLTNEFNDWVCYSPDGQSVIVEPKPQAMIHALWLAPLLNTTFDGNSSTVVDKDMAYAIKIPLFSPTGEPDPFCTFDFGIGWAKWYKSLDWQPSTGWNHNLGQLTVTRYTEVDSFAIGSPI